MIEILVSAGLVGAGTLLLPFFRLRQNRTATGRGVILAEVLPAASWTAAALLGLLALALVVLVLTKGSVADGPRALGAAEGRAFGTRGSQSAHAPERIAALLIAALGIVTGPLLFAALAAGSAALAAGATSVARASFGAGFWISGLGAWLLSRSVPRLSGVQSLGVCPLPLLGLAPRLAFGASLAALLLLALSGAFGDLALVREFASRRGAFLEASARHLAYALVPTMAAALIAIPLGRVAARKRGVEGPLFFVATAAQTIPTLSLLGLLVLPLSALGSAVPALGAIGVRGVGWAPASIALFLYALLPLAANARAGFAMVSEAARDAARGLGMNEAQLLLRVDLPLAAPALLAGFRTAFAQNLGNAVLAGLIGGGGLGGLVFLGLAQAAPDLVLLGSLPVVAAAFTADRSLSALERALGLKIGIAQRADAPAGGAA